MGEVFQQHGLDPANVDCFSSPGTGRLLEGYLLELLGLFRDGYNDVWRMGATYPRPQPCPSLAVQGERLQRYFPGICLPDVSKLPTPPAIVASDGNYLLPTPSYLARQYNPGRHPQDVLLQVLGLLPRLNPTDDITWALEKFSNYRLEPLDPAAEFDETQTTPPDVMYVGVSGGWYYAGYPPAYVDALTMLQQHCKTAKGAWRMTHVSLPQVLLMQLVYPELFGDENHRRFIHCMGTKWRSEKFKNDWGYPVVEGNTIRLTNAGTVRDSLNYLGVPVIWLPPTE